MKKMTIARRGALIISGAAVMVCVVITQAFAQTANPGNAPKPVASVPVTIPASAAPRFAPANLTPRGVRSMAATCSACHGTNGVSVGGAVDGLAGLNKDYFMTQIKNFREGKRDATLMHQISRGYSDAEISALADFFAAQKR